MAMLSDEYSKMYSNTTVENREIEYRKYPQDRYEFALLHSGKGNSILDVGMGGGEVLYTLKDSFLKFYGVELSLNRINVAKQRCKNMECSFYDISFDKKLDISLKDIDTVVCLDVLDHMIDVRQALKNIYKTLSAEGKLILTVPNIARINNRMKLLLGKFPSTSTGNEGCNKLSSSNLFDGGKLHYFTFQSLSSLVIEAGFRKIEKFGIGKRSKVYNLFPELLSGSIALVCYKEDKNDRI